MFIRIGWATDAHEVCAVDASGAIRHRATIAHSQDGLDRLVGSLGRWATEGELLVGIERPEGRLVDRTLEAGHPIVLVPTFAMKDFRRHQGIGGATSDRADCYVLADVTRTDGHRLRRLEPLSAPPGPAGGGQNPRRPGQPAPGAGQPAAGHPGGLLARRGRDLSPMSTPRSAWPSWSATPPQPRPPA